METHSISLPDRIAFISDAHLGMPGDTAGHEKTVAGFIRSLRGTVSHLYIVGDLFDFWFEYGTVVPNIAPTVIFELYNLVRAGTRVFIFGGNHDFWIGPYLRESVGLTFVPDDLTVVHQDRKMFIHHGDGLYPDDSGYRLLKKLLRNPLSIFLFRLLHPTIGRLLARLSSKTSREYLAPPKHDEHHISLFRSIGDAKLEGNFDAVIYGHSHVPLIEKRPKGELILLGDWIRHNSYVILENGVFTIYTWE